jgi:hypothetical protein
MEIFENLVALREVFDQSGNIDEFENFRFFKFSANGCDSF